MKHPIKWLESHPLKRPTRRQWIRILAAAAGLLLYGLLRIEAFLIVDGQPAQRMAERWDSEGGAAQISCFFPDSVQAEPETILGFEYMLKSKLQEASIEPPSENARLFASAYSAKGKITLSSNLASVETGAYGVGGDYFMFHPLELEPGSMYFGGDDMMQDRVLLDQNTAWQLFGSYDIAGQPITIGSGPESHVGVVAGVIRSESGWMNEKAGAAESTVYLSYEMLNTYGQHSGINAYEVVMPNPITGFAKGIVEENIGFEKEKLQIVENTSRYSMLSLFGVIGQFGTRSMNVKAIIYPYWENAARGWEDILSILLALRLVFLAVPVVLSVLWLRKCWKTRTIHWSDVGNWLADRREAHWARQAEKKAAGQKQKSGEKES